MYTQMGLLTRYQNNIVISCLTNLGIKVYRPNFGSVSNYLDDHENLLKPPIAPRDWAMTLGHTLYITPQYQNSHTSLENLINTFSAHNQDVKVLDRDQDVMPWLVFPSVVRLGRDLLIDICEQWILDKVLPCLQQLSQQYRIHISRTGDHSDGVFCPIRPGLVCSTHYRQHYEQSLPGWQTIWIKDTTQRRKSNGRNGRWWLPGYDYAHFNDSIFEFARNWIGNSQETVFEVNMLIVDEKNVILIAEDDDICKHLESLGYHIHVVDFLTRGFWDSGLHCLTTDIHREGAMIDYWPDRGNPSIYYEP